MLNGIETLKRAREWGSDIWAIGHWTYRALAIGHTGHWTDGALRYMQTCDRMAEVEFVCRRQSIRRTLHVVVWVEGEVLRVALVQQVARVLHLNA